MKRSAPQGGVLVIALFLMGAVAVALGIAAEINSYALRTRADQNHASELDEAAASAVAALKARLAQTVGARLGRLTQDDLDAINADIGSLPTPPAATSLLTGSNETGVRLVAIRRMDPIPHDERIAESWTDHPRRSFTAIPPQGGRTAALTYVLLVHASVQGGDGRVGRAQVTVAVSRVQPHQDALYVAGEGYVCTGTGSTGRLHGSVTADGTGRLADCGGTTEYSGSLSFAGDLHVDGEHVLATAEGATRLATVVSSAAELDPDGATAPWHGRLRMAGAIGAPLPLSRFSSGAVAGIGECLDFDASSATACAGAASFHPSLLIGATRSGFTYVCGAGYEGAGCESSITALTWHPRPSASSQTEAIPWAGAAPETFWKGFYPDSRRENRCVARLASSGAAWRTHRCPSNPWGWKLDAGALPPLPGGVLAVERAAGYDGEDPDSVGQTLLIRNARELQAPLTIISQVPVAIIGSYNVVDPKPSLIHAPRITVLPNEAEYQLRTTAVWDSVPPAGGTAPSSLPLIAHSNVTVFGVLRLNTCNVLGTEDYGGSFRAAPAVLGDWHMVGLRIVGAVEVMDETASGRERCRRWWTPLNDPLPSRSHTVEPRFREVLYDSRLLDPRFQPPGTWDWRNIPAPHAAGAPARTPTRQANATGGVVVFRQGGEVVRGRGNLAPAIPFPSTEPPLPSAPPPLP